MNLRKALFVFGGGGLIIAILAFRFGLMQKIFASGGKPAAAVTALSASAPQSETGSPSVASETTTDVRPSTASGTHAAASQPPPSTQNDAEPAEVSAAKVPQPESSHANEELPGMGDPFSYSMSTADDFSPFPGGNQVGEIAIRGIIRLKDQEPMAILQLTDTGRSYYVRTGNVIRIHTKAKNGSLISEAYIVVKDVRDDEVELIQQERPDKVIIVR